jgi:hypothetical protein
MLAFGEEHFRHRGASVAARDGAKSGLKSRAMKFGSRRFRDIVDAFNDRQMTKN